MGNKRNQSLIVYPPLTSLVNKNNKNVAITSLIVLCLHPANGVHGFVISGILSAFPHFSVRSVVKIPQNSKPPSAHIVKNTPIG
jgi:hypothetical protein